MDEPLTFQVVFRPNERIVSMVNYQGKVVLATEHHVYMMLDDGTNAPVFHPLAFREIT